MIVEKYFWEDTWVNGSPLVSQFPRLYNITFSELDTIEKIKEDG
jgi:hypothetical protein